MADRLTAPNWQRILFYVRASVQDVFSFIYLRLKQSLSPLNVSFIIHKKIDNGMERVMKGMRKGGRPNSSNNKN